MTSYAQFGEDTLIDGMLALTGSYWGTFVDIGAGDGMEISNSRLFRERGWRTVLVEADPRHWPGLITLMDPDSLEKPPDLRRVVVEMTEATPDNVNELVPEDARVVSIDVDGDDIFLLEALEHRPTVLVVEHNPTMPYWVDAQPARSGLRIGSSVAALRRVAESLGYGLRHVTHCNALFKLGASSIELPRYEPAYHVATEYFTGRPVVLGEAPWSVDFANPYPPEDVVIR